MSVEWSLLKYAWLEIKWIQAEMAKRLMMNITPIDKVGFMKLNNPLLCCVKRAMRLMPNSSHAKSSKPENMAIVRESYIQMLMKNSRVAGSATMTWKKMNFARCNGVSRMGLVCQNERTFL